MDQHDELIYAPIPAKKYDLFFHGTTSAYSKGPLPFKEALELMEHMLATNGAGYSIQEVKYTQSIYDASNG